MNHIPQAIDLMKCRLTPFESYGHAVDCISSHIEQNKALFSIAINPEKIYRCHKDQELQKILYGADIYLCDGIGASLAAIVLHGEKIPRITGISLFYNLLQMASEKGFSVYFLGASAEVNSAAVQILQENYPELTIAGSHHGYFTDDQGLVDEINSTDAQLVFIAMGSPRQEEWIVRYRNRLKAPFLMGVGGSFDVVSGQVRHAPKIFQKLGLEWLFRLVMQPSRIKRQLALPRFLLLMMKYRLGMVK